MHHAHQPKHTPRLTRSGAHRGIRQRKSETEKEKERGRERDTGIQRHRQRERKRKTETETDLVWGGEREGVEPNRQNHTGTEMNKMGWLVHTGTSGR